VGFGLYLHIPFCRARCAYCDFNTYAGLEGVIPAFVTALLREIASYGATETQSAPQPPGSQRLRGDHRAGQFPSHRSLIRDCCATIYFGGGTPSLLPLNAIARILDAVTTTFTVAPEAEISLEANPGTLQEAVAGDYLAGLRRLGVNRLSLGVQSFDDRQLRLLGRLHTAAEAIATIHNARAAGFDNLNLDLIYGLPGQKETDWDDTLRQAIDLAPEHLSCYALTLEDEVPMARWVRAGRLTLPDEETVARQYELAEDRLAAAGYTHYEISNWAANRATTVPCSECHVPGLNRETAACDRLPATCQHNLIYWRNQPYLGVGPGAHSSFGGRRWWNLAHPQAYIAAITAGQPAEAGSETIDRPLAMAETMILGLRLLEEGVGLDDFTARFGLSPLDVYRQQITGLVAQGLIIVLPDRVRLTRRGHLLHNQASFPFLPAAQ